MKSSRKLSGKILVVGTLQAQSPLCIGGSDSTETDKDVLVNAEGFPIIPATSFIGVWLSHLENTTIDLKKKNLLFGGADKKESQSSAIHIFDLTANSKAIEDRDGILLNPEIERTKIKEWNRFKLKVGNKYDYQIVPRVTQFGLTFDVDLFDKLDKSFVSEQLKTLYSAIEMGEIRFGSKTNNGFGKLSWIDLKVYHYDFTKPDDIDAWLDRKYSSVEEISSEIKKSDSQTQVFSITLNANIATSLLVRSAPKDSSAPDAVMLTSGGKKVLPGSSLKGPLLKKTFEVLEQFKKHDLIYEMWGGEDFQKSTSKKKVLKKANLRVEESVLEGGISDFVQTRIKIDRFTGGTIQGALLEEQPVFGFPLHNKNEQKSSIKLCFQLRHFKEEHYWQAGLLLFLIRDLIQGKIRLGGGKAIGRGLVEAVSPIVISVNNGEKINIEVKTDEGCQVQYLEPNEKIKIYTDKFLDKMKSPVGGNV